MELTFHRRDIDILVISDVHLGTPACRADDLLAYLKSVRPGKVILNGDIIDMQQFDRRYWPDLPATRRWLSRARKRDARVRART